MKILIVDDDPDILATTESILKKRDFEVVKASNGLEALNIIKTIRPAVILLDVLMPEMDGYTFYKALKSKSLTSDIPVLIVTGREKMEDSFKVLGVDGFITKPFTPEELIGEIEHILKLSENRKSVISSDTPTSKKKIIAVGSNAETLNSMQHQADKAGYAIEIIGTGTDTIARTVKFLPDIIFMDMQLPDMSAAELVDILKHLPQFEDRPIIGYCFYDTAKLGEADVRRTILRFDETSKQFLKNGAVEYMGRYHHQKFVQLLLKYFDPSRGSSRV